MSQHKGPPELCLACATERARAALAAASPTRQELVPDFPSFSIALGGPITELDPVALKEVVDYANRAEAVPSPQSPALAGSPGGDHYRKLAIQPIEYIEANGLDFHAGNVVKYVTRWRDKGGIEDLRKARFYIDRLIELEGAESDPDVADTAWAIIEHHHKHRTAG